MQWRKAVRVLLAEGSFESRLRRFVAVRDDHLAGLAATQKTNTYHVGARTATTAGAFIDQPNIKFAERLVEPRCRSRLSQRQTQAAAFQEEKSKHAVKLHIPLDGLEYAECWKLLSSTAQHLTSVQI